VTLSDFSIKRPVFAWILMFGLIFFGLLSFTKMGINENPDVDFPTINIRYSYEGATPAVIEKDVVEPVESVLVSMQGIRNITSSIQRGGGRITLEFELDKDINFALQEVNTLIGRAQRLLPENIDPPVVTKSNTEDRPIMYVALSSEHLEMRELMLLFRDRIRDRLSTVEGVAEIRAFGYHEPMLRIDLDSEKLKKYQLTAIDVVESIRREHQELPAGKLEYGDSEDLIRIMGELTQVSEFRNIVISRRGGSPNYQPLKLKDVANVYEGLENIRRISRVDGIQALGIAIQKQRGVNSVATGERVKERIEEINRDLQAGSRLSVNFDRTQFVKESVNELIFTVILSALLTALVCWFFIGSFAASVNVLLAIPTAIIGTFIFINLFGFTLNTFSLLGLALAIGIVVDDAIVMLENIIRYMQMGYDRVNAAYKGAREITFAVIATSVALIALFIPIAFMKGIEGRFFFEFAVTISVAVALSSLEALTLAPMRCSQFLSISKRTSSLGQWIEKSLTSLRDKYAMLLAKALDRRYFVLIFSGIVFLISLSSFKFLSTEFVPPQDRGGLFLIFTAPEGKSMNYTKEKVKEFEKIAMAQDGVKRVFMAIGGFGQGGQGNRGNGVVILKPRKERQLDQFEIAAELRKKSKIIKGIRFFIRDRTGSSLGGRRGSPIEFTIMGPDPKKQKEIYYAFKKKMDSDEDIKGTRSDDVRTLPEVHLIPNRQKALERGVEVASIASVINATYGGLVAAQYTKDGRRFDIYVQLAKKDRERIEDISKILVRNNRGESIPLNEVVRIEKTNGPQTIYRENRARGVRVDASLAKDAKLGNVISRIKLWSEELLPDNYFIRFSSTPEDKLWSTVFTMFLGLLIAYMILASQFNSFIDPWIVFLAIPFGLIGSLFALVLGGQTLNVYSAIGILLTMGIVKKNSILLVEFTNQLRDQGEDIKKAVIRACAIRFRPILMTNIATLAAALPPALALGAGSETRVPMALTVIGGVLISVVFTVFVVPCAYSLINPKRLKILEEK